MTDKVLNINIGILGHVDSGKTSLSKALSTLASTAAFDKHPQSQQRGITLDLGFSAFMLEAPPLFKEKGYDKIQCTLVDCPGHASLIRTIIGGAQIIDMMILVIDITKGMQTQTAEGLVIGELTTDDIIVVLNKIDSYAEEKREEQVSKQITKWKGLMKKTKFGEDIPIVPIAANPKEGGNPIGVNLFFETLKNNIKFPTRNSEGIFKFAIDHCFPIKGKGTVATGTVLNGKVEIGDTIELCGLNIQKKVKSIQMFKKPVNKAIQGDRVGILVTDFDSSLLERGLATTPKAINSYDAILVSVHKIKYYKSPIETNTKFHVSIGHNTTMASPLFFSVVDSEKVDKNDLDKSPPNPKKLLHEDQIPDLQNEFQSEEKLYEEGKERKKSSQFALIRFEKLTPCSEGDMFIASKLDMNIETKNCRIAFYGKILKVFEGSNEQPPTERFSSLKIFKRKKREATIVRSMDENTLIAKGLFQQGANLNDFNGLLLERTSDNSIGRINGTFGSVKAGKFKVSFEKPQLDTKGKLVLNFKKYIFDKEKKIRQ